MVTHKGTFLVMLVQVMNIMNSQSKWVSGQMAEASICKQKAIGPILDIYFRYPDSCARTQYTSIGKCTNIAIFMSKDVSIAKMNDRIKYTYNSVFVSFLGHCFNKLRLVLNERNLTSRFLQQHREIDNNNKKVGQLTGLYL